MPALPVERALLWGLPHNVASEMVSQFHHKHGLTRPPSGFSGQSPAVAGSARKEIAGVSPPDLLTVIHTRIRTMKILLLIPALGFVLSAISCRTVTPLDPMTMRQSEKCLPGEIHSVTVYGTK